MIIIYIDIILLVILLLLTVFTCGYCFYRVYTMQRNGQVQILLRPRKVLFSHKKEGESSEELRTVVAYHNPFTGDYCVRKSREPRGYSNPQSLAPPTLESPDSGLSDEYEPLHLEPVHVPRTTSLELPDGAIYPKCASSLSRHFLWSCAKCIHCLPKTNAKGADQLALLTDHKQEARLHRASKSPETE